MAGAREEAEGEAAEGGGGEEEEERQRPARNPRHCRHQKEVSTRPVVRIGPLGIRIRTQ